MIARVWHGWTTTENADAYETLLKEQIIPATAAKNIAGYRGVQVLRRAINNGGPIADREVEFQTIFYFDALENVKGFAGDDYETAYIPDVARPLLKRFEPTAAHYEVAARVDKAQGSMRHLECGPELLHYISANLRDFEVQTQTQEGKRAAAVAITILNTMRKPDVYGLSFNDGDEDLAAILLTRRSAKLKKHAGQWALPGGRIDEGESAEQAALRELEEEVGLKLPPSRIMGRLDDYTTRSGFTIKPVVVWGGNIGDLTPNPHEVQAIHRIPLSEFMREDSPMLHKIPESDNPVLLIPVGDNWIAAPTAAMLYQFREVCILGKQTRVAHYEQPYFAWK